MDDIVLSSDDKGALEDIATKLAQVADIAGLPLSASKSQGPTDSITAFNIELTHGSLMLSPERLEQFREALAATSSEYVEQGILGYVASVNASQLASI